MSCLDVIRVADHIGVYKVIGDTAALVAPLVVKALIRFSQEGMLMILHLKHPCNELKA